MRIRMGINGLGRMGRLALRVAWHNPHLEIVHLNEIAADEKTSAHLLEFDSVHGRWRNGIEGTQVKILAWYDSEMGYVHRMVELTRKIAGLL